MTYLIENIGVSIDGCATLNRNYPAHKRRLTSAGAAQHTRGRPEAGGPRPPGRRLNAGLARDFCAVHNAAEGTRGSMKVAEQRIFRERRQYNQWVANETLEDYALRFTATKARRWSIPRVANMAMGAVAFLVLEAIGATITLSYGFTNAFAAILVVGAIIFLLGLPVSYYAAKYGVDIDLLTRGAGFGYIGSTITSLIYASFTFIFFALEAAIMALALEMCFGAPLWLGYLISALVVIPLVTHGVAFLNRFQLWTQFLWLGLQLIPFIFIGAHGLFSLEEWTGFTGRAGEAGESFDLLLFGGAASVVFALVAQNAEQVDYLRFLPRQRKGRRAAWWTALVIAGPGWIVPGVLKMLAGSFIAVLLVQMGMSFERAAEPTQIYLFGFSNAVRTPEIAIALTGIFVVVSQLKINVTNAYAGSLAWSNFFSRLTHSHPGRVVWLVFNVTLALLLMELGIYEALERTLGLYSNIPVAWMGAIVADLAINKPLGLSPKHIEFKRAYLYDINPVGVGAMVAASAAAIAVYAGAFGDDYRGLAPFVALGVSFVGAPLIAWATRGRYYIARPDTLPAAGAAPEIQCCICEHSFEREDMAGCPVYAGPICSLCCSLDARCHDACKDGATLPHQWRALLDWILPGRLARYADTRLAKYLGLLLLALAVAAALLSIIYVQMTSSPGAPAAAIGGVLRAVFFILSIVAAIAIWPFLLVQESGRAAREETRRQTVALMQEIEAHQRTDAALQAAKETAEAASLAKSKYVRGISHELRTPLNAVLGYAQLLDSNAALPAALKHSVQVIRRSGAHLSDLVDGLLDISMIEAGKLQIYRDHVSFPDFLDQIVDMFSLQARQKGLDFVFDPPPYLPATVRADEKRLRQVLINLLSNAIRNTPRGQVIFRIRYSGEVCRFDIEDTGVGIADADLQRIFLPFERVEDAGRTVRGTGRGDGRRDQRQIRTRPGERLLGPPAPIGGSRLARRAGPAPGADHRLCRRPPHHSGRGRRSGSCRLHGRCTRRARFCSRHRRRWTLLPCRGGGVRARRGAAGHLDAGYDGMDDCGGAARRRSGRPDHHRVGRSASGGSARSVGRPP
jgi:signal transduction histidine kinase